MEYIYGKLNKETIITEYKGISTPTATTEVDNINHTIKVNVLSSNIDPNILNGALLYSKPQSLNNIQLNQAYINLKLDNYLDSHSLLQVKENQEITGNLKVNGALTIGHSYLELNNILPLDQNETSGLLIRNWMKDRDAKIYINNKAELRFDTEIFDQQIVTKSEDLISNKFTYWNGQCLHSRDIRVEDIVTKDYTPVKDNDLVTKSFTEDVAKNQTTYRVINSQDFSNLTGIYNGLRVHILEEAISNE